MAKRKKERQTVGKQSNTRAIWLINPVSRIKDSKKKYSRKAKHKNKEDF